MGLYSVGLGTPYESPTAVGFCWCKISAQQLTPGLIISVFNNQTGEKECGLLIGVTDYGHSRSLQNMNIILDVLVNNKMYDMACTFHHAADVWVQTEAFVDKVV